MNRDPDGAWSRAFGYLVGFGLVVCALVPSVLGLGDSFPFSTYPMFSTRRDRPTVHVAVGLDARGGEMRLGPQIVVGSLEVMQAAQTVRNAVRAGKRARKELCEAIALRVAAEGSLREIERIELRSLRFDPLTYFEHDPPVPLERRVRARCPVPRGARQ